MNAKQVLVLQMDVWAAVDGNAMKRKVNMTSIPDSTITIDIILHTESCQLWVLYLAQE